MPRKIWLGNRLIDLHRTVGRYLDDSLFLDKNIPQWCDEMASIARSLKSEEEQP